MTSPGMTQERPPATVRSIRRSRRDRVIAGVCGGLGEYFQVDPIWFRLAFIALALGGGAGILLYVIGWIVVPEAATEGDAAGGGPAVRSGSAVAIVGAVLVFAGFAALFGRFLPDIGWFVWPALLIAIGAGILVKGVQR